MSERSRFDPDGPLFAPDFLLDEESDVSVLIDPGRVRWIGTNRLGARLLERVRATPGVSLEAVVGRLAAPGSGNFPKEAHRRGFLSNEPFPVVTRRNRREMLEPDRLHEFWVVTNDDCNLRCRHCYTIEQVKQGRVGLGAAVLKGIIADAHALGAEIFYFTGGEPTIRPDFLDLARFVLERAKLIVFTNGTVLTEDLVQALSAWRERLIFQVSLEGPNEEVSRPVRGKDSLSRALAGIRLLLRHKIRVGVSTTPTGVSHKSVPELTSLLAGLDENGQRPEYHHLIMLLDRGGARDHQETFALSSEQFSQVLANSARALSLARQRDRRVRLKLTNEKIMQALASNGPAKDFCGAGYTILGVSSDGKLLPCAACMDDHRYFLGDLVDSRGEYLEGSLERLWRGSEQVEAVRRFSLAVAEGQPVRDLRYFHGGGCWKNMDDPSRDFAEGHPFAEYYERAILAAIREEASKGVEVAEDVPRLYTFMHRARIACAGGRKTVAKGDGDLDQGHCICFA
ncbi:MAG: radical SAM protein [Planctomycetota bacterium]